MTRVLIGITSHDPVPYSNASAVVKTGKKNAKEALTIPFDSH